MANSETITVGVNSFVGLRRINVILGRNGCGKSSVLRHIDRNIRETRRWQTSRYITPERGGPLGYDADVDNQVSRGTDYLQSQRSRNYNARFKVESVSLFRRLELEVARSREAADKRGEKLPYFSDYVDDINKLLDNVQIRSEDSAFRVYGLLPNSPGNYLPEDELSSGESELITLAIELLVFALSTKEGHRGLLLFDEPDVHLHPDLQARLMRFLTDLVDKHNFDVIIATHSVAILAELSNNSESAVHFMRTGDAALHFGGIDEIYKDLLPVFGAHPLTELFNKTRTLLLEGEDDVRIWQEAVRTTNGRLKLTPIGCGGTPNITSYEKRMAEIISSVYENGKAYSLRDGDGAIEELSNEGPIVKMRMRCYSTENLLLSDDVLSFVGTDWDTAKARIIAWCEAESNQTHDKLKAMRKFVAGGFDRKNKKIKDIRMLVLAQVLESNLPWEVLVGKVIGKLDENSGTGPDNLRTYLGQKAVDELLGIGSVT